ncbi:MAG: hypothetical protein OJJ54_24475 [Pseudonocardia sp.]|nr:hypothetical protein [Pseudonocardia sp.]
MTAANLLCFLKRSRISYPAPVTPQRCTRRSTEPGRSGRARCWATLAQDFDLDELLTGVPSYAVEDIAAVVGLADAGLASVRSACTPAEVFAGPTFAGSQDVGGADADWIAAGLLVDVKSTAKLDRLDPNHVYQLAGYALLDYDDRYQIERVGWYLTRAGWLVTWDLAEFVALLGTSRPVAELRERVADVLHR